MVFLLLVALPTLAAAVIWYVARIGDPRLCRLSLHARRLTRSDTFNVLKERYTVTDRIYCPHCRRILKATISTYRHGNSTPDAIPGRDRCEAVESIPICEGCGKDLATHTIYWPVYDLRRNFCCACNAKHHSSPPDQAHPGCVEKWHAAAENVFYVPSR